MNLIFNIERNETISGAESSFKDLVLVSFIRNFGGDRAKTQVWRTTSFGILSCSVSYLKTS
jgi:Ribonuclease G/E